MQAIIHSIKENNDSIGPLGTLELAIDSPGVSVAGDAFRQYYDRAQRAHSPDWTETNRREFLALLGASHLDPPWRDPDVGSRSSCHSCLPTAARVNH